MKKQFDLYNKEIKKKYNLTDESVESAVSDMNKLYKTEILNTNPSFSLSTIKYFIFAAKTMLDNFQAKFNQKYKDNKDVLIPLFHLEDGENAVNDIQMDGYYDYIKNQFVETLFSPNNVKVDNYIESTTDIKLLDEDNTTKLPDPNPPALPPPTPSPTATPPPPPPFVKTETNNEQAYGS